MAGESAGLLLYKRGQKGLEVLLVHPGGPFWAKKDLGAWSIPKGEIEPGEDPLTTALREFREETGQEPPACLRPLGSVRQPGGKIVYAWAAEADLDLALVRSGTFVLEWPPKSGRRCEFPEIDRAEWFSLAEARGKILKGQLPFLEALARSEGF